MVDFQGGLCGSNGNASVCHPGNRTAFACSWQWDRMPWLSAQDDLQEQLEDDRKSALQ